MIKTVIYSLYFILYILPRSRDQPIPFSILTNGGRSYITDLTFN